MRASRTSIVCLVAALCLVGFAGAASSPAPSPPPSPIRVVVDGVDLGPAEQARLIDGQVMVPLRAVAEALGATVRWEPDEPCVYITSAARAVASAVEVRVYVTKSGSKYHRAGCRYLSEGATEIALEEALTKGYEPCAVCAPPSTPPTSGGGPSTSGGPSGGP